MSEEPTPTEPLEMKVYIKPGCPWCIGATAHLLNEGYKFKQIDVLNSEGAMNEMVAISGQTFAPTLTLGDLMLADFGVPELTAFLDEHNIVP